MYAESKDSRKDRKGYITMDEKYIVPFITLLGAAVSSVILAYRVTMGFTSINYALMLLVLVIIIFFVIGKITYKITHKIKNDVKEKEREEKERQLREEHEIESEESEIEAKDKESENGLDE